ncbi:hypothetical protein J6590_016679 [Homalodisca vitripennis]|nr:hypothetical protein J6590_016679 [Homalodisca vitripennis]
MREREREKEMGQITNSRYLVCYSVASSTLSSYESICNRSTVNRCYSQSQDFYTRKIEPVELELVLKGYSSGRYARDHLPAIVVSVCGYEGEAASWSITASCRYAQRAAPPTRTPAAGSGETRAQQTESVAAALETVKTGNKTGPSNDPCGSPNNFV